MNIFISKKARDELYLHSLYKRKYSIQCAMQFFKDFNSKIQSLYLFPYMYPKISKNSFYRKILFNKKYIIIYFINGNSIYIDSIINCKQNNINF